MNARLLLRLFIVAYCALDVLDAWARNKPPGWAVTFIICSAAVTFCVVAFWRGFINRR